MNIKVKNLISENNDSLKKTSESFILMDNFIILWRKPLPKGRGMFTVHIL